MSSYEHVAFGCYRDTSLDGYCNCSQLDQLTPLNSSHTSSHTSSHSTWIVVNSIHLYIYTTTFTQLHLPIYSPIYTGSMSGMIVMNLGQLVSLMQSIKQ